MVLPALAATVGSLAAQGAEKQAIADKTLVAWIAPANLSQRGGSVLTLEKPGGTFDAIVFGELAASRWMAGSNGFSRTQQPQDSSLPETVGGKGLVQVAIVYKGKQITIYRNGVKYADYTVASAEQFSSDSLVLMGLRHIDANPDNRFFVGSIDDARIRADSLAGPWKYVGDLMANKVDGVAIDEDVSCADFFPIGGKRMLLCISHRLGARYYLGEWKNEQFHPTFHEKMSWVDNSFFAPESLLDDQGRRIMWAWVFDGPAFASRQASGWSGTMSLPRVLSLGPDGMLRITPPEEIEKLRYHAQNRTNLVVPADQELAIDGIGGNSIELSLEMNGPDAGQYGVKVCRSPRGEEETLVDYDATEKKLKVDTTRSSLTEGPKSIEAGPFELKADEPLRLRVFVDRSVVEVFANGRQAVMRRVYPSRADSVGVAVFSRGGPARVSKFHKWDIMPSNPY